MYHRMRGTEKEGERGEGGREQWWLRGAGGFNPQRFFLLLVSLTIPTDLPFRGP